MSQFPRVYRIGYIGYPRKEFLFFFLFFVFNTIHPAYERKEISPSTQVQKRTRRQITHCTLNPYEIDSKQVTMTSTINFVAWPVSDADHRHTKLNTSQNNNNNKKKRKKKHPR